MRSLQVLDFIPDFTFQNGGKSWHTVSLAGGKWVLFIFTDLPSLETCRMHFERKTDLNANSVPLFLTIFEELDFTIDPVTYRIIDSKLKDIFFDDYADHPGVIGLVMDCNQKIEKRFDFHPSDFLTKVKEAVDFKNASDEEDAPLLVPVLKVPKVFDNQFCKDLIDYFLNSTDKLQGRAGSSKPVFNTSLKRRLHVNTDPTIAKIIDQKLVFSLLPAIERLYDKRITHRVAYKVSCYNSRDRGFFTAHRDNSDPGTSFRRFGLSISLNDGWEGGGISFPEYSDRSFKLPAGDALVFPASILHKVNPVIKGERFVLLSFLYDADGAILRRSMMENTDSLVGKYKDDIDQELLKAYADFAPTSRFTPFYDLH